VPAHKGVFWVYLINRMFRSNRVLREGQFLWLRFEMKNQEIGGFPGVFIDSFSYSSESFHSPSFPYLM